MFGVKKEKKKNQEFVEKDDRIDCMYNGNVIGSVTFIEEEGFLIIDSIVVSPGYSYRTIGSQLVWACVEKALREGKKCDPLSPFAEKEFGRHPEYQAVRGSAQGEWYL